MDISEYRKEIDELDAIIIDALEKRFDVTEKIAEYKKANGIQVFDPAREDAIIEKVRAAVREESGDYIEAVFRAMFAAGREYQERRISESK